MELQINLTSLHEAKSSLSNLKNTIDSLNSKETFSSSRGSTSDAIEDAFCQMDEVKNALSVLVSKSMEIVENTAVVSEKTDNDLANALEQAAESVMELIPEFSL